MEAKISSLLAFCAAGSQEIRQNAEKELEAAQVQNLGTFVNALANILVDETQEEFIRQLAALVLKNAISAKDKRLNNEKAEKWLNIPNDITNNVKHKVLEGVKYTSLNNNTSVSRAACQILSKIAKIELCSNRWEDFFPTLLNLITGDNPLHKQASLVAIRYLCEDLTEILEETGKNPLKKEYCNEILTSVVQGMRDENDSVKAAATKALFNALLFAKENYENEAERNYIMNVVYVNCTSPSIEVQIAAFECLVQIASEYYSYLDPYTSIIFPITLNAIKTGNEQVAIPAMEFWNDICDSELDIEYNEHENKTENNTNNENETENNTNNENETENNTNNENETKNNTNNENENVTNNSNNNNNNVKTSAHKHYIQKEKDTLIPVLLETLTVQKAEDIEMDTWTIDMAAATCLTLCAQVLKNEIIEYVLVFVTKNFTSNNWKRREAAVLAFGCIMEGPHTNKLEPLVKESLNSLCEVLLHDDCVAVRDAAAWTIGRIVSFHIDVSFLILDGKYDNNNNDNNNTLLKTIVSRLIDCPRVAVHICWIISQLADNIDKYINKYYKHFMYLDTQQNNIDKHRIKLSETGKILTSPLDDFFFFLCNELIAVTKRDDAIERNLREAAFNCLSALIKSVGTEKCGMHIMKLLFFFLEELEKSESFSQNEQVRTIQGWMCGCIQCIITKVGPEISFHAHKIWCCTYKILYSGFPNHISEDALLLCSALVTEIGVKSMDSMPVLEKVLAVGLSRTDDVQLCRICTELVGDISRALGEKFAMYSEGMLTLMYTALSNPDLDRTLRPALMICVGDVAMAINKKFLSFLDGFMQVFSQAASVIYEMGFLDNEEWMTNISDLRDGILQAYSGIIYCMKDGNSLDSLKNYINEMLLLCKNVSETPKEYLTISNLKAAIALTGDIASSYSRELCIALADVGWVRSMITHASALHDIDGLHAKLYWLQEVLQCYATPA